VLLKEDREPARQKVSGDILSAENQTNLFRKMLNAQ
jgi:hypothetical protein